MREHTLFLQKHPTFCDNDGNITVDETFTVIICEGDGDIGVFDADVERDTEDALDLVCPPGGKLAFPMSAKHEAVGTTNPPSTSHK